MSEEAAGLAQYKAFIDELVARSPSVGARRMRERMQMPVELDKHGRRFPELDSQMEDTRRSHSRYNALLASLADEQTAQIAELFQNERISAIHDVLAYLTDGGYRLTTPHGVTLAFEPYGTESYFDYVSRLAGDIWPDER